MFKQIHCSIPPFALILCSMFLPLTTLSGQAIKPCPDQAALKKETDRLCRDLLPASGRIWFMDDQRGPCQCDCSQVYSLVDSVELFKKQRALRIKQRLKDWGSAFSGKPIHGGASIPGTSGDVRSFVPTLHPSGASVSIDGSCPKDEVLRNAVNNCLDKFDVGALTHLEVRQEHMTEACSRSYPDISGRLYFENLGTSGENILVRITIPSSFSRHPAVERELIEFMIMHELGHVFGYRVGLSACEWFADVEGVQVGLRALYPEEDVFDAMHDVAAQLRAYQLAIIDPDATALACDGTQAACTGAYPTMLCRTDLMSTALSSTVATMGPERWVEDWLGEDLRSCWSAAATPAVFDETTFCGTDCGSPRPTDRPLFFDHFGPFKDLLEDTHGSEFRMLERSKILNSQICERFPEACQMDPLRRAPLPRIWRHRISKYNHRAERLKVKAIQLEDQLRDPPAGF